MSDTPALSLEVPTDKDLIVSLLSTMCPICGGVKPTGKSMCRHDYSKLPKALRDHLYHRVGAGYSEAVLAAMKELGVLRFILPQPKEPHV
jgi:hypothetical protein